MRNNRRLNIVLAVVAAGIWGIIVIQFISVMSDGSAGFDEIRKTQPPPHSQQLFEYKGDVRDPFVIAASVHRDSVRKAVQLWSPPPMRLTGIVAGKEKRTAMIEAGDGAVFFLGEGDTARGIRLVRIADRIVTYTYQTKKGEWSIEGN